jgi:hypothetical protein
MLLDTGSRPAIPRGDDHQGQRCLGSLGFTNCQEILLKLLGKLLGAYVVYMQVYIGYNVDVAGCLTGRALMRRTPRKRGTNPMTTHTNVLSVRVSDAVVEAMTALHARDGISAAEQIRRALADWFILKGVAPKEKKTKGRKS